VRGGALITRVCAARCIAVRRCASGLLSRLLSRAAATTAGRMGCDWIHGRPTRTRRASRGHVHQVICATPTATWTPGTPSQVGTPGSPRVGPLTFDAAYSPGLPTRVILTPVSPTTAGFALTGWDCASGARVRFWYPPYGDDGGLPKPVSSAPTQGELTAAVPALALGDGFVGYMLFPGSGRWDIEVWQGDALVGNILFVLPRS
jgi:hypothetical protein